MTTSPITPVASGSRLFCTAAPDLPAGAILKPGDFRQRMMDKIVLRLEEGEVIAPDPAETGVTMMELAWEVVRLREFPDRPSRLDCLYLWEREAKARDFHSRRPWPTGLYEVEVIECHRVFVADMNLISYFEEPETVASLMNRARRYWAAEPETGSESREALLEGAARVVRDCS